MDPNTAINLGFCVVFYSVIGVIAYAYYQCFRRS